jgi:hypothetical protein
MEKLVSFCTKHIQQFQYEKYLLSFLRVLFIAIVNCQMCVGDDSINELMDEEMDTRMDEYRASMDWYY